MVEKGFDPMNFSKGKSADELKSLQLKEIKNGRLAMVRPSTQNHVFITRNVDA